MNWGHKLTIAIVVFVSWMAYMVYRCVATDFQLVEKDYYRNELRYQDVIDATQRTDRLNSQVKISRQTDKIVLQLPSEMKGQQVNGKVWFYCAYDENLDKKIELNINGNGVQELEIAAFKPGRYTVKIEWICNDVLYFREQKLTI